MSSCSSIVPSLRAARDLVLVSLLASLSVACEKPTRDLDLSDHNLLLITIDTLRADRLGSYGYDQAATPNLDRLARDGVRFESCHSPVPLTLPAHVSLFTGKYPFATGVRINGVHYLDESHQTLAELFRAQGFRTSAFVAAYVLISKFGLAQGFERYDDSLRQGHIFRFYSEIGADEVYRRFRDWLQERQNEQFFSWLHFYDPHLPYDPPPGHGLAADPYDGEVAFVDSQIGRIVADLEATGLLDETLVVVTSDHGEAFGEHVEEGHGLLTYDETLRVPLILHAPGRLPGNRIVRSRVALVDLLPTIVELFALEKMEGGHGQSLVPMLEGEEDAAERSLYFESLVGTREKNWAPRTGLISRDHKLIEVPEVELYDLAQDPAETRNLARTQRQLVHELREELERFLESNRPQDGVERELTQEDRRHLQALGYLSSGGGANQLLDPKRGIRIEMTVRTVRTLVEQGELDEAEMLFERLEAENPGLEVGDFYDARHEILSARGDTSGAVAALEEGSRKFPESGLAFKLAAYLYEAGEYERAESLCRELLAEDPKLSQALNLLGMIAERQGRPERALGYYEQALELEPQSIPLLLRIADNRARLGRVAEALAIYERLLADGALEGADALYKAGTLHSLAGNLERAEELFRRGLDLEPAGRHHIALAIIQLRAGKTAEAIGSLETALDSYRDQLQPQELLLAETTLRQLRTGS